MFTAYKNPREVLHTAMAQGVIEPDNGKVIDIAVSQNTFDPAVLKTSIWAVVEPQFDWNNIVRRTANPGPKVGANSGRELFQVFPTKEAAVTYAQTQNKYLIILEIVPDAEIVPQLPLVKEIING